MRLRNLQLIRFGHFSDVRLDFAADVAGLHVIYGHNEDGKSTALRAISGLLFGIPERTTDAFRHEARALRIGAELERDSGERLEIVRRKGRKDTLLNPDETPLSESALDPFLDGVSREIFEAMFGIDHGRLVEGGRQLLEGRGEVGQALFGAAAGLRGLRGLVDTLGAEATALFKPSGQNPRLNRALAEHRDARQRIRLAAVKPADWESKRQALDEAREAHRTTRQDAASRRVRLEERKAFRSALPDLRDRESMLARRAELGSVVLLPSDAAERRRKAQDALEAGGLAVDRLEDERAARQAELDALEVPERLLAVEPRALDLGDQRAIYVNACVDLQKLRARIDAGRVDLEERLRTLPRARRLEDLDRLDLDAAHHARIRNLARDGATHHANLASARRAAEEAARKAEDRRSVLEGLPAERDTAALRSAIEVARKDGDLETQRGRLEAERSVEADEVSRQAEALPLWTGEAKDVAGLPIPGDETLAQFERQFEQLAEQGRALAARRRQIEEELERHRRERSEIESAGSPPEPQDLRDARAGRDRDWTRIRRVWLRGDAVGDADLDRDAQNPERLADDYERNVARADDLGDQMFAEHARVARISHLRDLEQGCARNLEGTEQARLELDAGIARLERGWNETWAPAGIEPRAPREMRGWKTHHQELLDRLRRVDVLRAQEQVLADRIRGHREELRTALESVGGPLLDGETRLATLLEAAEALLQTIEQERQQRLAALEAERTAVREAEARLRACAQAEALLAGWLDQWAQAVVPLDLTGEADPAEAEAVLEKLDGLGARRMDLQGLVERARHIEQDNAVFEARLAALVSEGCPELRDLPPADRAAELLARLRRARDGRARQEAIRERLGQIDIELQERAREHEAAEQLLTRLREQAEAADLEALVVAEERSAERRRLDERLLEIEERLGRIARPLAELAVETANTNEEDLSFEIGELEFWLERHDQERDELSKRISDLEREFSAMDGGEGAAEAASDAEEALARITELAAEYARRRVAELLLRREIQRYAKQNQGPILDRAGEFFRAMTLGRYIRIQSEYSEREKGVLLYCERPDAARVGVEGLSDGTRDQLYLSLRLAALEHHMERNECMPLIVDDVLVTFDDRRSAATLALLGKLAERTQILFFTHHQRLVDLAHESVDARRLRVHTL